MNIQQAKTEIRNTLRAYLLKDEEGKYRFPTVRQRPILLMGPPGIGKTAILKQVAQEAGVGLVSYAMTHHTRQSAVGLPQIEQKSFHGQQLTVTEYTMSEIIAAVYDCMEKTGKQEGILFLDEVNCVSETLAPTMLQLLQNKTFGSHSVPEGWILVTAGNPPEYNKSVREFDVATLDRVRTISIQPDCSVWLQYARQCRVHSAILSYLTIRPEHFYLVEDRGEEKHFVTARGWEDLSELLKSYEELQVPVTGELVHQYLQEDQVAKAFAAYYGLYRKYDEDYDLGTLLKGELSQEDWNRKAEMAEKGGFEERFTVIRLLVDGLEGGFLRWDRDGKRLEALRQSLLRLKRSWNGGPGEMAKSMENSLNIRRDAGILSEDEAEQEKWVIEQLEAFDLELKKEHIREPEPGFEKIKELFGSYVETFRSLTAENGKRLRLAFRFAEQCFGEGQELALFITELSGSSQIMAYIAENGSEEFLRHSDAFAYRAQEQKLMEQCRQLME